jgi:hypothetical protein
MKERLANHGFTGGAVGLLKSEAIDVLNSKRQMQTFFKQGRRRKSACCRPQRLDTDSQCCLDCGQESDLIFPPPRRGSLGREGVGG